MDHDHILSRHKYLFHTHLHTRQGSVKDYFEIAIYENNYKSKAAIVSLVAVGTCV